MDSIPIKIWGLKQTPNEQILTTSLLQAPISPFYLATSQDDESHLITARTFIKIQRQIFVNNKNPNVQVIILDHNDMESPDTDLFKSAFNNLAFTSYCTIRTLLLMCDLTRPGLENENFVKISDNLGLDLRRLCLHWPGRCYYSDLNQVIKTHDWSDKVTLSDSGQGKLAASIIRVLNSTPKEIFN
jgi:hypothetical protein